MTSRQFGWWLAALAVAGCGGGDSTVQPVVPSTIAQSAGMDQTGVVGSALADSLTVRVTNSQGNPAPNVTVTWSVLSGDGTVSPGSSITDANGVASALFTLGPAEGQQQAQAAVAGLTGSPVIFTATAAPNGTPGTPGTPGVVLSV